MLSSDATPLEEWGYKVFSERWPPAGICLARGEAEGLGDLGQEGLGALPAGRREAGQHLPGLRPPPRACCREAFARDHCRTQLPLGQVVGRVHVCVVQKGEEVVALFGQTLTHSFFGGVAPRGA